MFTRLWLLVLLPLLAVGAQAPALLPVLLTAPPERCVIQRDAAGQGLLTLAGTVPAGTDAVVVSATLAPGATRGTPVDWTQLVSGKSLTGDEFKATLSLASGGWYRLEVRALRFGQLIGVGQVQRVGIGDVYLIAGATTAANSGQIRQYARDERVVFGEGERYHPARDPLPGAVGAGGTPWPLLGDLLVRSTQVPVCFRGAIPALVPISSWGPGSQPYLALLRAMRATPGGVRAILWQHGENDALARVTAKDYHDRLAALITGVRTEAECAVDWFVAASASHPNSLPAAAVPIVEAQMRLWRERVAFQGPWTDDLVGGTYRQDGLRFNALGLQTVAERWYAALWARYLALQPLIEDASTPPAPLPGVERTAW